MIAVVAARDEADRIGRTLASLAQALPGASVWVADDGSRDATAEIARAAGATVLSTASPRGKGAAMTAAVRSALEREAADERPRAGGGAERAGVVVLCDGDLGDSARELAALARAVCDRRADVAVAVFARRVGGGVGLVVRCARLAIARRCGLRTRAPLSGQRALSARALADVLPFAPGYGMEVAMTIDAVRAGHRLLEIELELEHRASGRTPGGFAHRARQLADVARAYRARA